MLRSICFDVNHPLTVSETGMSESQENDKPARECSVAEPVFKNGQSAEAKARFSAGTDRVVEALCLFCHMTWIPQRPSKPVTAWGAGAWPPAYAPVAAQV